MSYLLKSSDKRRGKSFPLIVIGALVLLVFVINFTVPDFFGSLGHTVALPLWKTGNKTNAAALKSFSFLESKKSLIEENTMLREKLSGIEPLFFERERLKKENEELKRMLGRYENTKVILASIITKPNRSPYDTVVIDAGSAEGVEKKDKIVAGENVLIGEVEEVFSHSALVRLYSSPGVSMDVSVGDNAMLTTITGKGGGTFEFKLPKNSSIAKGSAIISLGIEPHVVGVVESVFSSAADTFETILARSALNIFTLRNALVVKK